MLLDELLREHELQDKILIENIQKCQTSGIENPVRIAQVTTFTKGGSKKEYRCTVVIIVASGTVKLPEHFCII